MNGVHVCPTKDIECGRIPDLWCAECPKWSALRVPDWTPSRREYFAALAMQGLLSSSREDYFYSADGTPAVTMADNYRYGAQIAVSYADALIAALNAEPQS